MQTASVRPPGAPDEHRRASIPMYGDTPRGGAGRHCTNSPGGPYSSQSRTGSIATAPALGGSGVEQPRSPVGRTQGLKLNAQNLPLTTLPSCVPSLSSSTGAVAATGTTFFHLTPSHTVHSWAARALGLLERERSLSSPCGLCGAGPPGLLCSDVRHHPAHPDRLLVVFPIRRCHCHRHSTQVPEGSELIARATRGAGVNLRKRDPLKAPENWHMQSHPFLSLTDAKLAADRAKCRKSRGDTAPPRPFPGSFSESGSFMGVWVPCRKVQLAERALSDAPIGSAGGAP